jgi:Tfp pilus assembly protein PilF
MCGREGFDMRFGTWPARLSLGILLAMLLADRTSAQTRVVGTVSDDAGKPVRAATVTAQHPDTGQTFTATTDAKGKFTVLGLRPGRWRFIAEAPGHMITGTETTVSARMNSENAALTFTLRRTGALAGALGSVLAKDLQTDLTNADALFAQQKWDEAIKAYREILAKAPPLSALNLQIAAALRGKADYDGAIAVYSGLLKTDPTQQRAQVGIGETHLQKGDIAAAETYWTQLAAAGTAGRDVFYSLGELEAAQGNRDAAVGWYARASTADPSWGKPLYQMGIGAIDKGDKAAAQSYLTRAISVDPTSPEAALAQAAVARLK